MSVKGLRKIIYPFAPDQSGAAAVFYELGGMVIICDAGGCAGNICGFDEPRWFTHKSAVFSAGLRDMDAILGRDDLMIEKIAKAAQRLDAGFVAIIGTPVPATIATDYRALRRMAEKRTGLPAVTVDTNGALLYDDGEEKAYCELFRRFAAADPGEVIPGSAGVIGATALDTDLPDSGRRIAEILRAQGASEVIGYGSGSTLPDFEKAGRMERNIVVSPAGLRAARELKERFGTAYECCDPLIDEVWRGLEEAYARQTSNEPLPENAGEAACRQAGGLKKALEGKRILIIHQQVRANALRDRIKALAAEEADISGSDITVATWFKLEDEIAEAGDVRIREEEDFFGLIKSGFDVVIADGSLRKAAKGYSGLYIDLPHFAVSGRIGY